MSIWRFANRAVTVLASPVAVASTGAADTIAVASALGFPVSAIFALLVEAEIMHVTGVTGLSWGVLRGMEGTAPVAHQAGKPVVAVLTAAALDWLRDSAGGTITVMDEGLALTPAPTLNFIGGQVTAVYNAGANRIDIYIPNPPVAESIYFDGEVLTMGGEALTMGA